MTDLDRFETFFSEEGTDETEKEEAKEREEAEEGGAEEQEAGEVEVTEDDSEQEGSEKDDEKPHDKEGKHAGKRVPLADLISERKKRQHLEEQVRELQERFATYEEARKPKPEPEPEPPPFEERPVENLHERTRRLEREAKEMREAQAGEAKKQRDREEFQQLVNHVGQLEAAFVKENDDYYEALEFMRNVERDTIRMMAPEDTDPVLIDRQVSMREVEASRALLSRGLNPAQTIYNMAKRYGYRKAERKPEDAEEQLRAEREKRQQARTLGGGKTAPSVRESDPGDIEEFGQAMEEMFGKRRR